MNDDGGAEAADTLAIFDALDGQLVCRVCGVLVPAGGGYDQVHWDWHEAANGA